MASSSDHQFHFDPAFEKLYLRENCEPKFFCEVFSLMDAMRVSDTLHNFSRLVKEKDGHVTSGDVLKILMDKKLTLSATEKLLPGTNLEALLQRIYSIVLDIIMDKYVASNRTATLSELAWHVGDRYIETYSKIGNSDLWKSEGEVWHQFSYKLAHLAEHQVQTMRVHHDFQKSNYAPDPRTKNVYGGTVLLIIAGIVYSIWRSYNLSKSQSQFENIF